MNCSKCSTHKCLTQHHQNPVTHFGKKNNKIKVCLCRECHDVLESQIKAVEDFVRGYSVPARHKLEREDYEKILRNFLGDRKIIYVST
jgi:transcription elongation factor Elf1